MLLKVRFVLFFCRCAQCSLSNPSLVKEPKSVLESFECFWFSTFVSGDVAVLGGLCPKINELYMDCVGNRLRGKNLPGLCISITTLLA